MFDHLPGDPGRGVVCFGGMPAAPRHRLRWQKSAAQRWGTPCMAEYLRRTETPTSKAQRSPEYLREMHRLFVWLSLLERNTVQAQAKQLPKFLRSSPESASSLPSYLHWHVTLASRAYFGVYSRAWGMLRAVKTKAHSSVYPLRVCSAYVAHLTFTILW